jgi:hypothetical protein
MQANVARSTPEIPPAARQQALSTRATRCSVLLLAALSILFIAPAAFAGSTSATMQVSVSVIARAVLTVTSQPEVVTVTEADVARGYVDVATPISLLVRTNSRAGYLLQVERIADEFGDIELTFEDAAMTVTDQAWISRPYIPGGESLVMRARVHLAACAQPGAYPLAMAISARPL